MKNLIYIAILTLLISACSGKKEESQNNTVRIDSVEIVTVKKMQPSRSIVLPGDLKPWEVVNVQAKVKGYIGSVRVDRGSFVRRGTVLATLEAPEMQAQLAEARAKVEDVKSKQLASKLTYTRMLQTSKTQGAVAANELDLAHSKMMIDSMQVLSASASYRAIVEMVNYLNIVAPFDGTIIERNVSPGELVGPDRAKPMFVLENSETLRLTVGIPEVYSGQVKKSDEVAFKVSALPERIFKSALSRSSQSLDVSLRSMMAEFDVKNSDHLLKAGMYAEVTLPMERSMATTFVPSSSVVNSTERIFVIQVIDGKAKWVDIKTGVQTEGMIEIFGSVEEGVAVVAKATEELRDGTSVVAFQRPKSL